MSFSVTAGAAVDNAVVVVVVAVIAVVAVVDVIVRWNNFAAKTQTILVFYEKPGTGPSRETNCGILIHLDFKRVSVAKL